MSRIMVVATTLIVIGTILAILLGLQELFTKTTLDGQFSGFYLFGCGLFFTPIALIPFRKGEKWAWYTALLAGGIALIGQLLLVYLAGTSLDAMLLPSSIILVVMWGVAIGISAKPVFAKKADTSP
jgi:ABC-type transport system involved in cytochrome c biogenesis permease component